jgi:cyclic beta-1,2-glucan synthetase
LLAAIRPPADKSWRAYYRAIGRDAVSSAKQFALTVIFLPHQAWLSVDAIGRTLIRLFVTRRKLLEWQPAAQVEQRMVGVRAAHWQAMRPAVLMVIALALVITAVALRTPAEGMPQPSLWRVLVSVWPLTLIWIASPSIATWLSRETGVSEPLPATAQATVRRYVEHHWRYFDRYITADTNWLVPDNVQFEPEEVVAMRTSPTNIGLQLLTVVSAHDLGLIDLPSTAFRLEQTLDTLDKLRRFRGHFYNWYAIDDLHVLEPAYVSTVDSGNLAGHLIALKQGCLALAVGAQIPTDLQDRLISIAARADQLVMEMDFTFLFDAPTRLFAIGYHPDSHTMDASFYDLLASEARLAAFVAIAKDDVPVEAWFRFGRALIRRDGVPMLVSWSGSMFEYLMPQLVMESFPGTLLDQSDRAAIAGQIAYGRERNVPWGVSESAYNYRDLQQTYQYRAFGVPDLALKRGLGRDLVIAPYASALAAMQAPKRALANLAALEKLGALGEFGFWDALDFTRPDPDARFAIVKTVMAHHAGMSVVAFTNLLRDNIWRRRFHDEAMVRAAELLLQERVPRRLQVQQSPGKKSDDAGHDILPEAPTVRRITAAESAQPRVALLGDLPYTVMVTHAGSGYSQYESLAVNRFRADATTDDTGQFCYLRDLTTDRIWSAGHQPIGAEADQYHVYFAPDRATFHRIDGKIETRTEIVVVQGDCAEVRRVTLTNHASEARDIELTSYGEVVMAPLTTDAAHPAFSNLFVETEWHDWCSAIMARRRPRRTGEPAPWCVHVVDSGSHHVGAVSCETDRSRFIGRGRTTRRPAALDRAGPLSGEVGAVLDPILALRTTVRVPARESVTVSFTTLVATTREHAFELADRYHDQHASQRALDLAWMATQLDLREVGMSSNQAAVFQEIAGHLIYGREAMRPPADELRRNQGSQARLWTHGISGDLPIVLALIDEVKGLATLRELFTAHRFWRRRGLAVDLVIIVSHPHDYLQELRHAITEVMFAASDATMVDQPGGVFIRRRDAFLPDDYLMLSATARVHIPCDGRPLARIVPATATRARSVAEEVLQPRLLERRTRLALPAVTVPAGAPVTAARNGYGQMDGENNYAIEVTGDHVPPAPWSNVIANQHGGFLVSERGSGFTWAANSYFYRLTPWHNDPVSDPPSDVIYLRDAERGDLWSATPAPIVSADAYQVNHGPGRSVFTHRHGDIETELTVGLPTDAAVKLSALRLTNHSRETRTITITAYAEWTLGVRRETTGPQVRTRLLPDTNAIIAQNFFDAAFSDQVAFMATTEPVTTYTADRREFLGRHGTLAAPVALSRDRMSAATGVGLDPCAALQFTVTLSPGEMREVAVLLGAATGEEQVRTLLTRFNTAEAVRVAIDDNVKAWNDRLSTITVRTPDAELDTILNRWSLYQALSSRMWGRTGLYQSSGAYGFRDQLQDVMAFVYAEPAVAREHLLRAAARQFVEGDVQHWWHPHTGRGVRTRFSDDLAWLPFVVDHYITTTGDTAVLDEYVPFLTMRQLAPDEHEVYDLPRVADEHGSIYEHCLRSLRRACTEGAHGLPLIGTGDWNDGFSRVGIEGHGESVWLAWFLIINCRNMAVHAESRGDSQVALELLEQAERYVAAVAEHGWDGAWYRRAYYDDGVPMGSAGDESCQIDSIAQSWSVISGAASMERQRQAMASLQEHLVDEDLRLIKLLTPAFDQDGRDPGYIKGYLPGVRENGAQYTHAALWAVQATAMLGEGDRAWELYRMINPLTHADTPEAVAIYKVEPYVVAADVYTAEGQLGRGGWTWYTGSASWMYRVGLESLLGFKLTGDTLEIIPCVPMAWPSFEIDYRYRTSTYRIKVIEPAAIRERGAEITVDGALTGEAVIRLVDDGAVHEVSIVSAPVIARPPYTA